MENGIKHDELIPMTKCIKRAATIISLPLAPVLVAGIVGLGATLKVITILKPLNKQI